MHLREWKSKGKNKENYAHDKNWKMKMNEYRIKENENKCVNDKKIKIILGLKKIEWICKLFKKKRTKAKIIEE